MAINTTTSTATTTKLNKTYYDRKLLAHARTNFVHAKFGQRRSIPENNGKRVEFRRWDLFDPSLAINGLTDGVTPTGQNLSQSAVEAEVKQYGAFVEISDLLKRTAFDDVMRDSHELLGEQLGTVLEWVTRDRMNAGNNVQFANGKTSRISLAAADKLTTTEVRKAVRTLKKNKARLFNGTEYGGKARRPHYICICGPDATYDLQSDTLWQDVSKYANAEQIYAGELGRMFGVIFVESTEAKIFSASYLGAVVSYTSATKTVVLSGNMSDAAKAYLESDGAKISVDGAEYGITSVTQDADEDKSAVVLASAPASDPEADDAVFSMDAGAAGADVFSSLVFGKEAYGTVDIGGAGGIQSITKPLGSAGADDPLDQRATVGAKVPAYTAVILNDLWLVRIEHGATA